MDLDGDTSVFGFMTTFFIPLFDQRCGEDVSRGARAELKHTVDHTSKTGETSISSRERELNSCR